MLSKCIDRQINSVKVRNRPKENNKRDRNNGKVVEKKSRRGERRNKSVTTDSDTTDLEQHFFIISNMKLPLVVLSLVLIYGTYRIYAQENWIQTTNDDQSYISNDGKLFEVPLEVSLERSLSRPTRSIVTLPLTTLLKPILGEPVINVIETLLDFTQGILAGRKDLCPKTVEISDLISMLNPIKTIQNIICFVLQKIGSPGRELVYQASKTLIKVSSDFFRKVFLPELHKILNNKQLQAILPPNILALIAMFNACYLMLKVVGYVQ